MLVYIQQREPFNDNMIIQSEGTLEYRSSLPPGPRPLNKGRDTETFQCQTQSWAFVGTLQLSVD